MNGDLSIIDLVMHASLTVKAVMAILVLASVISWIIIISKWFQLRQAQREAKAFEDHFWRSADLSNLYRELKPKRGALTGLERVFEAGFAEYGRLFKQSAEGGAIMVGTQRSMRIALTRETDLIESHLSLLATIGSVSPYIGLFGTVWGIMSAFIGLGQVKQATLAMVAPGIAEALIATAIGLFAAIPAVIGYNRYSNAIDRLLTRYEAFADEFSSLLHRQVHSRRDS